MQMTNFMENYFRYLKSGKKEYTEEEVRTIINGAIAAERESCAKLCEEISDDEYYIGRQYADMIRTREQNGD